MVAQHCTLKQKKHGFSPSLTDGYAILMSSSKGSLRSHPRPIIPLCPSREEFFFPLVSSALKKKRLVAGYSSGEPAVHGCHCSRDIVLRMRDVMARQCVSVSVPLAVIYWLLVIHLPRACRGRTALRFLANSSHMCCVELALDRPLCTHLGFF